MERFILRWSGKLHKINRRLQGHLIAFIHTFPVLPLNHDKPISKLGKIIQSQGTFSKTCSYFTNKTSQFLYVYLKCRNKCPRDWILFARFETMYALPCNVSKNRVIQIFRVQSKSRAYRFFVSIECTVDYVNILGVLHILHIGCTIMKDHMIIYKNLEC